MFLNSEYYLNAGLADKYNNISNIKIITDKNNFTLFRYKNDGDYSYEIFNEEVYINSTRVLEKQAMCFNCSDKILEHFDEFIYNLNNEINNLPDRNFEIIRAFLEIDNILNIENNTKIILTIKLSKDVCNDNEIIEGLAQIFLKEYLYKLVRKYEKEFL